MRRSLVLALVAAAALAAPATAAAPDVPDRPDVVGCFQTYVTRADPVPRTPAEHVAAVVGEADHAVRFATCLT